MTADKWKPRHEENLERIRSLRLLDDDFMTICFEGEPACAQLVLRIILEKPDLRVVEVHTQVFVANLGKRSVRLDVLAVDSAGRKYDIEIQREDKGAGQRRARFNSRMQNGQKKGLIFRISRIPSPFLSPKTTCWGRTGRSTKSNAAF